MTCAGDPWPWIFVYVDKFSLKKTFSWMHFIFNSGTEFFSIFWAIMFPEITGSLNFPLSSIVQFPIKRRYDSTEQAEKVFYAGFKSHKTQYYCATAAGLSQNCVQAWGILLKDRVKRNKNYYRICLQVWIWSFKVKNCFRCPPLGHNKPVVHYHTHVLQSNF